MSSKYRRCAVLNCFDRNSHRHKFPNPDVNRERFNKWIELCGNAKLHNMEPNLVFRSHRVCHQHFTREDITSNMYINRTCVPSQKLPIIITIDLCTPIEILPVEKSNNVSPIREADNSHITTSLQSSACTLEAEGNTPNLQRTIFLEDSADPTPNTGMSYSQASEYRNISNSYKKRSIVYKQRQQLREKRFKIIISGLNRKSILINRRHTITKKLRSLMLFKYSYLGYSLLAKWFGLPSKRSLIKLFKTILVGTDINQILIGNLKTRVKKIPRKQRVCILVFDAISLLPHIASNTYKDKLVGTKNGIRHDSALIFMVKSLTGKKWKQTVSFSIYTAAIDPIELKKQVVAVVKEINNAGLDVVSIVCNGDLTNRKAIEGLVFEAYQIYIRNGLTPKRHIIVNDKPIFPLYDCPSLLKGIRDLLLNYNLIWDSPDGKYVAMWGDILKAYQIDSTSSEIRILPKITDSHIVKGKIKKEKLSCAKQVISHTMAATICLMARYNISDMTGDITMETRAIETAKILKFFDDLYDSVSGIKYLGKEGRPLNAAVKFRSKHITFWKSAVVQLHNMYFHKPGEVIEIMSSILNNWIVTLEGFIDLRQFLLQKNITYFFPGQFNIDVLEKWFP